MDDLRVLVFDIETAPLLAYVWDRRNVNIALNQIKNDWFVIAWAAKWLGDSPTKIQYADGRACRLGDDRVLLKRLWELLDKADIVITQNGKAFDSKKLNARFIMCGMPPPKPYRHIDTYKLVSSVAKFTSGRLEYLTDKLCTKYKKLKHKKFPGMVLWSECLAGNIDAWDEMKRYNIHDVLATEELYMKIRAWTPANLPTLTGDSTKCRVCKTATKMWHKGYDIRKSGRYHRYQCQVCFAWTVGGKA